MGVNQVRVCVKEAVPAVALFGGKPKRSCFTGTSALRKGNDSVIRDGCGPGRPAARARQIGSRGHQTTISVISGDVKKTKNSARVRLDGVVLKQHKKNDIPGSHGKCNNN